MPILNFQKRFVPKILSGEKRQTIRAWRKRPIKVNDILYLYTGLRTKYCKKLKEVICKQILEIDITIYERLFINGIQIIGELKDYTAQEDGFENYNEMIKWFKKNHKLPFAGQIIIW